LVALGNDYGRIREIWTEFDIQLICDEVMTSARRIHRIIATEH